MRFRTVLLLLFAVFLNLLIPSSVYAQAVTVKLPEETSNYGYDLSGIWEMYGAVCDEQPEIGKVRLKQRDELIAATWLEVPCGDEVLKNKLFFSAIAQPQGKPFVIQALSYRNGDLYDSLIRFGYVYRSGEVIVMQERDWQYKWFLVRAGE